MIRILHVVSALHVGGVENMLYNYYKYTNKSNIRFDFIVHDVKIGMLEHEFRELGCEIFHITPKRASLMQNFTEMYAIIKKGQYSVVHCHQNFMNFVPLLFSLATKVPIRISHSHGWQTSHTGITAFRENFLRFFNRLLANRFFACSLIAGKWLHGKEWFPNNNNLIMRNAIDLDVFFYDEQKRCEYRHQQNLEGKVVLLHVGRFSPEKNHTFIIDLLEEISKTNENYILLFAGNGKTEDEVKEYVKAKKLDEKVMFLGPRTDVSDLMNAADILIHPSFYEGFGITLIEAQSTGLTVLSSDRVPIETSVTDLIDYIPLESVLVWKEKILNTQFKIRRSRDSEIESRGFSAKIEALAFESWLAKQVL